MAGAYDKILAMVPEEKKDIGKKLVQDLKFMDKTLRGLRRIIEETGCVVTFKNGKQKFDKESPASKSYNAMMKTRTAAYAQLIGLIPKAEKDTARDTDDFDAFVAGRDD